MCGCVHRFIFCEKLDNEEGRRHIANGYKFPDLLFVAQLQYMQSL